MGGPCLGELPSTCRAKAYDYCSATWRKIAAQHSGEIVIARGEVLHTEKTLLVTGASGGQPLGSGLITSGGNVDRVIIKVPELSCSGDVPRYDYYFKSGALWGVWIGGKSGHAPYPGGGCITSGKGLWTPVGTQKELYVQKLDDVYLVTEAATSGYPVTYLVENIIC